MSCTEPIGETAFHAQAASKWHQFGAVIWYCWVEAIFYDAAYFETTGEVDEAHLASHADHTIRNIFRVTDLVSR